ncbi:MAG: MotA/TolQ/ExbB proton channel family protein [Bacteroidota bacterium]|nr:MotA/TolQ/ExbB proton channel family protein [Bacteroidota bacterium]MDP3144971.1 MotA/TolQ/ExbB proton channel family protein [Bacteroidota bacterium]MDP3556003.1 MotA/TolQ/ExbB proton channel family protein [Bacteroidota bacterium]
MLNFILQAGAAVSSLATSTDSNSNSSVVTGIQTAATSPEITETKISLFEMILKGGPIMYPIGLLLLISIYLLIERLLVISKASKKNETLVLNLKEMIHSGNIDNARSMCKNMNTPESTMLEQGISRIGQPIIEIREAMNKSGVNEIGKLEKNLNVLSIIGRIAPMFGFVGTIIGVITIFRKISQSGTVEIVQISDGLYQKMVSSAGGLVVGVIAFIFYYWLNSRLDRLAHRMEDTQIKFLDMLNEPTK